MRRAERNDKFLQVDIYPVTCERLSGGRSNLEILAAVIAGGARIIQLREKEYSKKDFYLMARQFREVTAQAEVLLIINDHMDIALAVDADGIHLGQGDLPLVAARKLAPEMLIGISTHSLSEALEAERDGADYINIGPIFPTKTKEGIDRCLGPEAIAAIGGKISMPFTVMGGINGENIAEVYSRGARRVAVVTAVTQAADVKEAVRLLKNRLTL